MNFLLLACICKQNVCLYGKSTRIIYAPTYGDYSGQNICMRR